MLSPQNAADIQHVVANLDAATAGLPQSARSLQQLLNSAGATVQDMREVVANLRGVSQTSGTDIVAAVQKLRVTADNLASASAKLDNLVARNGDQISATIADAGPQLEALLRDSRAAVNQINDLARSLRENPSRLLYQSKPVGVAIPP